ncbi:site-specific integrase [Halorubellus sp. PRR65]|uniref:site-specific integrase n=1 Tax=Halorubellus sp. PRR65 TaxID=3098148 RepID=UPI002B257347|nr:site-specific integrase [Halorubellus sp. PRR65]
MSKTRAKVGSLRDRIQDSPDLNDEDRELLLKFSDKLYLLKSEYSDYRHEKLLRHCTRMGEIVGGLGDALEDKSAAEDIVRWINQEYDNEYTNQDYRSALRTFGKRVSEGDETPPSLEWIPTGTSNSHDPIPNPADMLRWEEDVIPMIEASRNSRDKALLAVAFDSGARSGEIQDLTVGDVNDHKHGLQIIVDGKQGQRSVTLIPAVPYLQRWLSDHPTPEDHDAPLWSKLDEAEDISYRNFRNIFQRAGDKAGVSKPNTPTNFRKSNATYLAEKGMNEAFINDRQGRSRGSEATAHYVAKFGGRAEDEYARLQGIEVDADEPEPIGPVKCPRCGNDTPRHEPACVHCQQAIDHEGIQTISQDEKAVRDALLRFAKDNPELLDDYQSARNLTELFEDRPELFEDVQSYIDAVGDD